MARERRPAPEAGMPERLARFAPAEWPPEGEDARGEASGEYSDRDRLVFAWDRYSRARLAWVRAHGGSKLAELRAHTAGRRRFYDDPEWRTTR